nr:unnamed protein product [Digitaria exilis]
MGNKIARTTQASATEYYLHDLPSTYNLEHERRLERIRNAFKGIEGSHVWPFQVWLQTDKAAYLLRQYFFCNLHERLNTRPFLSQIAKKWLTFQEGGGAI